MLVLAAVVAIVGTAQGRDPRRERLQLNAADGALARQITVRRGDVGAGWRPVGTSSDDSDAPGCQGFRPDFSAFTITGRAASSFARREGAIIQSQVEVYKSRADAAGDFRAGAKPVLARCLRLSLAKELGSNKAFRSRIVSARMVTAPRVGERSAEYRVVITISALGSSFKLYFDSLVFQRGRSIAALAFTGARQPLVGQVPLARLVAARMR